MIKIVEGKISIEDYKELRKETNWFNMTDEQIQVSIDNTDYMVYAKEGDSIVGMARCINDSVYMAFIYDVIVREDKRSLGIGKQMINEIINHFKKANCLMQILVIAVNSGVEGFYKNIGFKKYPNLLNGSGMGMWINGKPY